MKSFKVSSFSTLLLLVLSCVASLLMGCSGGGGGGGGEDPDPEAPVGLAPAELKAGMQFDFIGGYEVDGGRVTYLGPVDKSLSINSDTSGNWVDRTISGAGSGSATLVYDQTTPDAATIVATGYRLMGTSFVPKTGRVGIRIQFTTATSGVFNEVGIGEDSIYSVEEGTFTFTPAP